MWRFLQGRKIDHGEGKKSARVLLSIHLSYLQKIVCALE